MSSELTVSKNRVVTFHYTIRNGSNEILETTRDGDPIALLHGHGQMLPGIENALRGHGSGETLEVTLAPEDAYGERREDLTQRISKKYLPKNQKLRPGMTVRVNTERGPRTVTVLKVGNKMVDVDLNHPFAGETLTFELELTDVRDATPEELAHGHAHGKGGHQHG